MTSKINDVPSKFYVFIGLGIMGYGMAKNLRSKLPEQSVLTDVIITMLPRGDYVRQVFTDPQTGLLSLSPEEGEGKAFIDCSTIDVKTSQEIGKVVQQSGLGVFADVSLSGGQGGANAGTLTFMVGGEDDVFETINPILALMGKPDTFFHCVKLAGVINSREQNPVKGVSPTASSARLQGRLLHRTLQWCARDVDGACSAAGRQKRARARSAEAVWNRRQEREMLRAGFQEHLPPVFRGRGQGSSKNVVQSKEDIMGLTIRIR
ncbi:hypothetical protein DER46DRAFT_664698 [Fusarium sp. MPI-SDFR-AT-0072]|nr:hypothetical protein DER46DRAFT_664698 [Fusarium sp. MPI-SDFR-AT-0072]